MPADLTREEIDDYGISLVAGLLSGVQAERLLAYIKDEPTRLASAHQDGRREGYREGVEAAARWHDDQAEKYAGNRAGADYLHRMYAERIRGLSPPPAEPSTTKLGHTDLMVSPEAIERVLAADDDGWIEWKGGECPVAPQTEVEAILRSGRRQGRVEAARLRWDQPGWQGDIVSYRIVKPAEPRHEPSPVPGNTGAEARREPAEPSAPSDPLSAEVRSVLIEAGRLLTSTPSEELAAVDAVVDRMAVLLNDEPSAPVAEDGRAAMQTRMTAASSAYVERAAAETARLATLETENAKLRERGELIVAALDGSGANAQLLVSAVDGLRALLQGGADAATV